MIAWREVLDLVCRTRGTCLRWWWVGVDGRQFGGTCVRGCGGVECQWLLRPIVRSRLARGTAPPDDTHPFIEAIPPTDELALGDTLPPGTPVPDSDEVAPLPAPPTPGQRDTPPPDS
jgi:hypothetical protein